VASCLNLNRAQRPRVLGVKPELLAGRFTFASVAKGLDRRQGWELLNNGKSNITNRQSQIAEIPAIGDANSIQWAMGKEIGIQLITRTSRAARSSCAWSARSRTRSCKGASL